PLIPRLISHQVSLISQLKSGEAWGGPAEPLPADFDDKRWAPGVAPPNLRAELTLWPHASPRSGAIAAALMGERRGSKSQRSELRGSKSRPASRRNEAGGFAASGASGSSNGTRFEQYTDLCLTKSTPYDLAPHWSTSPAFVNRWMLHLRSSCSARTVARPLLSRWFVCHHPPCKRRRSAYRPTRRHPHSYPAAGSSIRRPLTEINPELQAAHNSHTPAGQIHV
ncbi:unnamed protein product, partial [Urochloa humidicola]